MTWIFLPLWLDPRKKNSIYLCASISKRCGLSADGASGQEMNNARILKETFGTLDVCTYDSIGCRALRMSRNFGRQALGFKIALPRHRSSILS